MAITPVTNPTSTVLFKAIVAAKTRNAIIFRPSPLAVRCAERVVEILREAGEAAGLPPGALQVIPDRPHEVTHHLFQHPGVDFIWTTGGPKIVGLGERGGQAGHQRRAGQRARLPPPHADMRMAVVDILISKTFDASVICPAEQTCVVDDEIYDEVVAEFERMGARAARRRRGRTRCRSSRSAAATSSTSEALGQPAAVLAARAGIDVDDDAKVLLAPLPDDLDRARAPPARAARS